MGLSKDNIDVVEDIKRLELSTGQKRRLRRKKLKAARAESLDVDGNIQKELLDLKIYLTESLGNNQGHVSNKKQKHECNVEAVNKAQDPTFKETLINNRDSNCDKPSDSKTTSQVTVSNKNHKSTPKDTKNQEFKGDRCSITNEYKLPQLENTLTIAKNIKEKEKKTETENLALKKKQKSKLDENHQIQPENLCLNENKKNKSDSSCFTENQTAIELNGKQAVLCQSVSCNQNKSPKPKDLSKIKTQPLSSGKDHGLIEEQIIESFKSDTDSTNSKNLELKNQELHKIEFVTNVESSLVKQNMGKIKDNPEAHKQEDGSTKTELKKDDNASSDASAKSREDIKAAREAKKLAKQKAKQKIDTVVENTEGKTISSKIDVQVTKVKGNIVKNNEAPINKAEKTKTVDQVSDLKLKEKIPPTVKVIAEDKVKKNLSDKSKEDVKVVTTEKPEDTGKSKAELKAERRAKQEAQRAAKQEAQRPTKQALEVKPTASEAKDKELVKSKEDKSPKSKAAEKSKSKTQSMQKVNWFQHLCVEKDKESLNNIPINSNLHPAVVKLGVQLAERVITGSNARCIALLDAIKKMVRDYSLPARTEFGRGLQPQLAAAAAFLWARRTPAAAETNALKHFRRQLTHLPANVDEFDAKKQLQEEIDRYIREQIDMAGEAISLILRNKISPGDHILTYGCSSLIERVLCAAWEAGVRFRATVAGARGQRGPEMLRRLRARGLPATYVDISALSYVMTDVQKVLLGAGALLAHGAALGAAGSALVALVARARNVPVLVACETHKFSERTHIDPLVTHEIGDPDELVDKTDPNSPLKDWRSNGNLTLLNVTYDVTPPSLITAVVTELGILPCTSAPVVLRFKQSEYGM